jgi:Ca2+-binding EF-hand superfamily protein
VDFHFELQTNMKKMEETLKNKGLVTRGEIRNLLNDKDDKITEGQVEVFFRLLDTDGKHIST